MSTAPDTAVNILDELLHQAFMQGASDVHFESGEKFFRVSFRIDGLLRIAATPSPHLRDAVASRLKVLARMDIAEKRVPLDGRIQHPHLDQTVDLRASSLPTLHGEKIVIRILNFSRERPSLDVLGYEPHDHAKLRHAIGRPHGLILMTGPTGSGKTSSLYSCLALLNRAEVNISTVEDPSEIHLSGVSVFGRHRFNANSHHPHGCPSKPSSACKRLMSLGSHANWQRCCKQGCHCCKRVPFLIAVSTTHP
jgi:type IV pilus assembly protein PilB